MGVFNQNRTLKKRILTNNYKRGGPPCSVKSPTSNINKMETLGKIYFGYKYRDSIIISNAKGVPIPPLAVSGRARDDNSTVNRMKPQLGED